MILDLIAAFCLGAAVTWLLLHLFIIAPLMELLEDEFPRGDKPHG